MRYRIIQGGCQDWETGGEQKNKKDNIQLKEFDKNNSTHTHTHTHTHIKEANNDIAKLVKEFAKRQLVI